MKSKSDPIVICNKGFIDVKNQSGFINKLEKQK
jgi:hypothetical protein